MRLIDADKLIEVFAEKKEVWRGNGVLPSNESLMWLAAMGVTSNAPTIDAVPVVHGKWMTYKYDEKQYRHVIIPWDGKGLPHDIFCSECRTPALLNGHEEDVDSNYCPKCGAKMDLEEDQ